MHNVSSPKSNRQVMSAIHYYHMTQYIHRVNVNERVYSMDDYNWPEGLRELVSKARSGDVMMISYFFKKGNSDTGGHTIAVYGYDGTDSNGNYKLNAYDNRNPNKNTKITVSEDYSTCVVHVDNNENVSKIEITSDFSAFNQVDIDGPNNDMGRGSSPNALTASASDGTEIYVSSNADVLIENRAGDTMRVKNGIITSSTMNVKKEHLIVHSTADGKDVPGELVITVDDSSSFTFEAASKEIDVSVVGSSYYCDVSAANADSVTMSAEGAKLCGSEVDYTVTQAVRSDLCDMFSCSGTTTGNAMVSFSDDKVRISGHAGGALKLGEFYEGNLVGFSYNSPKKNLAIPRKPRSRTTILARRRTNLQTSRPPRRRTNSQMPRSSNGVN